jgi:hypothetical protein
MTAFFIGVLSSIVATYLYKRFSSYTISFPIRIRSYLVDLEVKLKEMPFIYKDLGGDVISDFVEVQVERVDPGSLKLIKTNSLYHVEASVRLKNSRKILFLGNAGVGKTTFQRHVILKLIRPKIKPEFLYPSERPVPVYVPLKVLDNMSRSPILRYITATLKIRPSKILKLAGQGKLFLFLDGYDEIPFASSEKEEINFIREELNLIMNSENLDKEQLKYAPDLYSREFYKSLESCRVWLSSRKEFFENYPIEINQFKSGSSRVSALEISGVGNNRVKLANGIFNKYRQRSSKYSTLFNDEYFIQEIDRTEDKEIRTLSYNPLFLTVMCYIYAKKVIDAQDCEVSWTNTFYGLVTECIRLLLRDLDEEKARGLPKAQMEALLRRRNSYLSEKLSFLAQFAFNLYCDKRPMFDLEYLYVAIRSFFKAESTSPERSRILSELDRQDVSYPNFALQLIFSGIFVTVDRRNDKVLYDYPHRRFREVLACEFISTPERYEDFLSNIDKPDFSEFKMVFSKSPRYQDITFGVNTLKRILSRSIGYDKDDYFIRVSYAFVSFVGGNSEYSDLIGGFLFQNLLYSNPSFFLSRKILEIYNPDNNFNETLISAYKKSLTENDINRFCLSCELLFNFEKGVMSELIERTEVDERLSLGFSTVLIRYLILLRHDLFPTLIERSRKSKQLQRVVFYTIAKNITKIDVEYKFLKTVFDCTDQPEKRLIFYFMWKYANEYYLNYQKLTDFNISPEIYTFISLKSSGKWNNESDVTLGGSKFFVGPSFKEKIITLIPDVIIERRSVKHKEGLSFEKEELIMRLDKALLRSMIIQNIALMEYVPFSSRNTLWEHFSELFYDHFLRIISNGTFIPRNRGKDSNEREVEIDEMKKNFNKLKETELLEVEYDVYLDLAEIFDEVDNNFKPVELKPFFHEMNQ